MQLPYIFCVTSLTVMHNYSLFICFYQGDAIPVALVENSGRCNKNENIEKVLPCGTAWIPNLVKTITEVALNGSKPILVNKKLIEGPNPDRRWKEFIPLVFAFQYFFIIKPLQRAIKNDMARETRPAWELRDTGLSSRKF
ncbi:translocase of chloroplast 34, chloroplastic-like [Rhodamnia argentea]|uniref:Translocase of chloroplast 34, chloroplastic-like n=1 Tax=Rhodamnia argentea TaxID=178133 RepID=A0ABM3HPW2_9MYRT|nr:translocase of chloroplast 34, chloroplastic-like [Rhodamnia argentea]XP_048138639.1 translocase of chloroplast 34, chloroplastic-like [Rhodamnia argentea]